MILVNQIKIQRKFLTDQLYYNNKIKKIKILFCKQNNKQIKYYKQKIIKTINQSFKLFQVNPEKLENNYF